VRSPSKRILHSLFICISLSGFAQPIRQQSGESEKGTAIDLQEAWMTSENGTLKIISNPREKRNVIHFFLTEKIAKEGSLEIKAPVNSSFFVDNKLVEYVAKDTSLVFDPNSLLAGNEKVLISIYGDNLSSENLFTAITKSNVKEEQPGVPRMASAFRNFLIFSFLISITFTAILRNTAPNISMEYFQVSRCLNFRNREELIFKGKYFTEPNPLFYLVISLLSSFLITSLLYLSPDSINQQFPLHEVSFFQWLGLQMAVMITFYLMTLIKWILIKYFSELFNLREFSGIHFFNYERYSFLVLLLLSGILMLVYAIFGQNTKFYSIIIFAVTVAGIYRIVLMLFKLLNASNYKLFHLFSYLCATEIIPYLIAVKLILI